MTVSYFLKQNQWSGKCALCGEAVAERSGFTQKDRESGKWQALCRSCVREHGRVTPLLSRGGGQLHGQSVVTRTAVALYRCNRCDAEVGLVKSSKSGKWYFAETAASYGESRATRVWDMNAHDCDAHVAAQEAEHLRRLEQEADALTNRAVGLVMGMRDGTLLRDLDHLERIRVAMDGYRSLAERSSSR